MSDPHTPLFREAGRRAELITGGGVGEGGIIPEEGDEERERKVLLCHSPHQSSADPDKPWGQEMKLGTPADR